MIRQVIQAAITHAAAGDCDDDVTGGTGGARSTRHYHDERHDTRNEYGAAHTLSSGAADGLDS